MAVSSYGAATKTSGVVRILKDLDHDLKDLDVLVVEDIVDSGLTLKYLLKNLAGRKPASLEVAALLRKEGIQQVELDVRYVGFDIPNEFVVGLRARLRGEVPQPALHRHAEARRLRWLTGNLGAPRARLRQMRSFLLVLVVSLSLFACSSGGRAADGRGQRVGDRRADLPGGDGQLAVSARRLDGDRAGHRDRTGRRSTSQTDDQGNYRLSLPDGTYEVTPVIDGGGPPSASPVSVTVTGGAMQTLDLQVDTGIR